MNMTILALVILAALLALRFSVPLISPTPTLLGITSGSLHTAPNKPNWVSSTVPAQSKNYVAPLTDQGNTNLSTVLETLSNWPRTKLITANNTYVHFEQRSYVWGFVDDIEIHQPVAGGDIHLRSASRLGYSDAGVNRARIKKLKSALTGS